MTEPPSGTPRQHRRRRRDLSGTPISLLGMLMMVKSGRVDPDMAAVACLTTRQTILQAIHRLREQGLVIETYPQPPGPQRVQWYKLDDFSRPRAWNLLAWWSEPDPTAWSRYTKQMPMEANIHDSTGQPDPDYPTGDPLSWPSTGRISDVEAAHDQALDETDSHW